MAVVVLCSAKHSPGVTVTALACTLTWSRRVILAECDPAGGDVAAGYLREVRLDGLGLDRLTASLHRRRLAEDLWTQLVDLAPGPDTAMTKLALPGLSGPAQAVRWAERPALGERTGWEQLARLFRGLEDGGTGFDVIVDAGRLCCEHAPTAMLAVADVVLLVLRPTIPDARAAAVALSTLTVPDGVPVGLVMVGDGAYSGKDLALELRRPVIAVMPDDPGTARVLSYGGECHRGRLLRAAARTQGPVWELVEAGRAARSTQPAALQSPALREAHRVG